MEEFKPGLCVKFNSGEWDDTHKLLCQCWHYDYILEELFADSKKVGIYSSELGFALEGVADNNGETIWFTTMTVVYVNTQEEYDKL